MPAFYNNVLEKKKKKTLKYVWLNKQKICE